MFISCLEVLILLGEEEVVVDTSDDKTKRDLAANIGKYIVVGNTVQSQLDMLGIESVLVNYDAMINPTGPTGPTGAASTVTGPTGATGAASTVTGPTGPAQIPFTQLRETVYPLSYASTITPDAANGSIQTVTLTNNVIFSAFANPISGQSISLIITQDNTGSRLLTSTMKFAGGIKTLSTAGNSVDILNVKYVGTTYYASLTKGYA